MLSKLFKKKPAKKKTVVKTAKKAAPPVLKPLPAPLLKSNKIITAEGWHQIAKRHAEQGSP